MAVTLITNIKQLVGVRNDSRLLHGKELAQLPVIENAYLLIEEGFIADYGPMTELQKMWVAKFVSARELKHCSLEP